MEGSQVEVYLNTPLLKFKYRIGKEDRELLDGVVRLSGKVIKESLSGFTLSVAQLSNMKVSQTDLPFETIFIPMSKVDFVVLK